jgi:Tetrahydrodipicolinate N-succinyltransferase
MWNTDQNIKDVVFKVIDHLEIGAIRVSNNFNGKWVVNEWVKKAIIMYFSVQKMNTIELGPLEFYDKIPIKNKFFEKKIRVVPHAIARYGSYISPGVVLMPSYVNIGAYIGENTMIDTWATVGSCAQIGNRVHVSGGVGIGGVLEPLQGNPVIIENDAFIGSRCILVEGVLIKEGAVLGANVVITASTKIFDVTNEKTIEFKGIIPKYSVVIPGSYPKKFPSGIYHVPCAIIIGKRKESTDKKISLNEALRTHNLSV